MHICACAFPQVYAFCIIIFYYLFLFLFSFLLFPFLCLLSPLHFPQKESAIRQRESNTRPSGFLQGLLHRMQIKSFRILISLWQMERFGKFTYNCLVRTSFSHSLPNAKCGYTGRVAVCLSLYRPAWLCRSFTRSLSFSPNYRMDIIVRERVSAYLSVWLYI